MTKVQNFKMFIDGQWVDSESGKTIETLNPENNEVWATVPEASTKDVDKAVKAAQNAFEKSWSNLHPRDRAKYLKSLANQLRDNVEMINNIKTKTLVMTGSNDSGSTVEMSKSLSSDLINSSFIEINNGKHLCSIECADDVNINLKNFINN